MRKLTHYSFLGLVPLIVVVAFIGIAPFGDAFLTSFFHDTYGEKSFAGIDNYRFLLTDRGFAYSLSITLLWAGTATLLSIGIGFLFAATLTNGKRRFASFFYGILLIPWGIPVYIAVPIWRAVIHGNGGTSVLTNLSGMEFNLLLDPAAGFLSAITVSLWLTIPLTTFVLWGAIKKIPRTVIEAAELEGAGRADKALSIYLPAVLPTLAAIGLLNFIKAATEFTVIFLMTSGGPPLVSGITEQHIIGATTTLSVLLYEIFSETDDFGITASYAMITTVIVFLVMVFWLIQRRKLKRKKLTVRLFVAFVQPLFFFPWGLLWSAGYLAVIKSDTRRRLYSLLLGLQWIFFFIALSRNGFFQAFTPGIVFATVGYFFLAPSERDSLRGRADPNSSGKKEGGPRGKSVKTPYIRNATLIPFLRRSVWGFLSTSGVTVMIAATLLVLFMLLWMSLSRMSVCYIDSLVPPFFSPSSYLFIFTDEHIHRFFLNTLVLAIFTGALIPLVTFPTAALLSLRPPRLGNRVLTTVQLLGIAGGMHTLIPLYSLFLKINLINTYVPLVLIYLYHAVPFSLFTMTAYLNSIPESFRDYAELEGSGPLRYTFSVLLPVSLPVISTSIIVAFLGAWNGFMAPLLFLNDDTKYTISIKLYSFVGGIASGTPEWNLFAAASVVNMVILAFLFRWFKDPMQKTALYHDES